MIHRHNRCIGLTLFRWGKRQIEAWFVPAGEFIEPHWHYSIDSTIVMVWGRMFGRIGKRSGWVNAKEDFLRRFQIPAGVTHCAESDTFTVFLNIETWREGTPVTSAATDFSHA